jgi:hypothetical protein
LRAKPRVGERSRGDFDRPLAERGITVAKVENLGDNGALELIIADVGRVDDQVEVRARGSQDSARLAVGTSRPP